MKKVYEWEIRDKLDTDKVCDAVFITPLHFYLMGKVKDISKLRLRFENVSKNWNNLDKRIDYHGKIVFEEEE